MLLPREHHICIRLSSAGRAAPICLRRLESTTLGIVPMSPTICTFRHACVAASLVFPGFSRPFRSLFLFSRHATSFRQPNFWVSVHQFFVLVKTDQLSNSSLAKYESMCSSLAVTLPGRSQVPDRSYYCRNDNIIKRQPPPIRRLPKGTATVLSTATSFHIIQDNGSSAPQTIAPN